MKFAAVVLVESQCFKFLIVFHSACYVPSSSGVVHDVDVVFGVEVECCYVVVISIQYVTLVVLVEVFFWESSADEEFFCVHF